MHTKHKYHFPFLLYVKMDHFIVRSAKTTVISKIRNNVFAEYKWCDSCWLTGSFFYPIQLLLVVGCWCIVSINLILFMYFGNSRSFVSLKSVVFFLLLLLFSQLVFKKFMIIICMEFLKTLLFTLYRLSYNKNLNIGVAMKKKKKEKLIIIVCRRSS